MENQAQPAAAENWQVNPGAALRLWVEQIWAGPEHSFIDGRFEGIRSILLKADGLKPVKAEKLLMTAAKTVNGIELAYGLSQTGRPGVIDHFSLSERGAVSQMKRYTQVFDALGFNLAESSRVNDHGMRVIENTYVSPHFIEDDRRLVIVELVQPRENEVSLFAEIQPYTEK